MKPLAYVAGILALAALAAASGCGGGGHAIAVPAGPAIDREAEERGVYSALLGEKGMVASASEAIPWTHARTRTAARPAERTP